MGVIVGPQRGDTGMMERFLSDWMQRSQQKKQHRDTLAQNESQFGRSYELDKTRTDNDTRIADSTVNSQTSLTNQQRAKMAAEALKVNHDTIMQNAGPEKAAEYAQGAMDRYKDNPEVVYAFAGMINQRERLPIDDENASFAEFGAATAKRVAGGTGSAQDQNFAFKRMTGEQLNGPAFGDARSAQVKTPGVADKDTEYGTSVRMGAGLLPTATDQLEADTDVKTTGMQVAGQERMNTADNAVLGAKGSEIDPVLARREADRMHGLKSAESAINGVDQAIQEYYAATKSPSKDALLSAEANFRRAVAGARFTVGAMYGQTGQRLSDKDVQLLEDIATPGRAISITSAKAVRDFMARSRQTIEAMRQNSIIDFDPRGNGGAAADDADMIYDDFGKRVK
jgi:hypothetical protein